jgi:hypothetical protein
VLLVGPLLLALATAPLAPRAPLPLHDLERTQVTVSFGSDGTFRIDVRNDADWMLARLEPLSGAASSSPLEPAARDRRLGQLTEVFARWTWVYFDEERVPAAVEYLAPPPGPVDPTRPAIGTMRLTGRVPPGAKTFWWADGLVIDPYPLVVLDARGARIASTVQGDLQSERFALADLVPPPRWRVARTYLGLGFTHILPDGLDHLFFVLALLLLSLQLGPALAQLTTYAVAQAITLALAVLGVLSLPGRVVEPLIALSIAWVAFENLRTSELRIGRIALVFAFGLLHGLGFASVLADAGTPRRELGPALLGFNVGVGGAELAVIAAGFVGLGWMRDRPWYRERALRPLSLALGCVGLGWAVARVWPG